MPNPGGKADGVEDCRLRAAARALALIAALAASAVPSGAASTSTIFSTQAPTNAAAASKPVEVGVKFRSDSPGTITGIRFYKFSAANSGTHVGDLWSASGQLLASAAFTGETASGWQTVVFPSPVSISSNTTYVASYHTTTQYSVTRNYFTSAGVDNPPLHALKTGVSGVNGVYAYGTGPTFPNNGVSDSNWWADVLFQPASSQPPPPPGCLVSAGAPQNQPFSAQSGSFEARFDATPQVAAMDGAAGLSSSASASFTDMASIVRFNTSGSIDARNGGAYAADASIPYTPSATYHFRLTVDVPSHSYTAYVSSTGAEQVLASRYAFRTEQSGVASLNNLGVLADAGSLSVCSLSISTAAPGLQITALTPRSRVAGAPGFQLYATGTGFDPGAQLFWNGSTRSGFVNGNGEMVTVIQADDVASVGTASVTVVNGSGAVSNSLPFEVRANTGPWRGGTSMNSGRGGHTATLLGDGRVAVIGGVANPDVSTVVELFDPNTSAWTELEPNTVRSRVDHQAVLLADGRVLAAGGHETECCYQDAVIFDPRIPEVDATGSMNTARSEFIMARLGTGRVLAAGGLFDAGQERYTPQSSAEIYDPVTQVWTSTSSMAAARSRHAAAVLQDGRVLVAGGFAVGPSGFNTGTPLASAEIFNPATGAWAAAGAMASARAGHTLTLLPDGRVLAAGGGPKTAEVYNPATNSWTSAGTMAVPRSRHTAVLLANGRVLVAGGETFDSREQSPSTSEVYDPATNAWTAAGELISYHSQHTATRLPDGRVLVAGSPGGLGSDFTELYPSVAGIVSLSPSSATAGGAGFALSVYGTGFSTNSIVKWNGSNRATSFVSASTLTASIAASDIASPGAAQVSVTGPGGASNLLSFTINSGAAPSSSTTTIFTTQAPTNAASASQPIEVGVKFRSDSDGNVIGVRFFKFSSANSGTHIGDLWSSAGQLLASATFIGETASGWQTVLFSKPVAIQAGATYVASYHTTTQYSVTRNYFTNAGVDNAPLHALKTGASGVNGAYAYGAGPTFPVNGVSDSNWWADVIFQSTGSATPPPPQPPMISSLSPNSTVAGSGGFTLSVFGQDFSTSSVVQWNNATRPTTFGSASTLSATIFASDVQSPGGFLVRVLDPAAGTSNSIQFSVIGSTPTAQWAQTGPLANLHYGQPLARLLDGRIFVPGGDGESQSPSEIYDPTTDNWTVAGSAQPWSSRSATTLLDGRVLLAGGRGQECCVADAELFTPGTTSYAVTGSLKQARASDSVTLLLDGRVLAAGGQTDTENKLASAEIYDPAAGTWSLTGSMAAARFGHAAVRLADGRVLVAGGANSALQTVATVEIYDPAKGTWSAANPMSAPREGPMAVLLKDGRVLVAGGGPASAEIFDPSTGDWTSTGSMASSEHGVATLLPDGSVLVEGGGTNTAERYDPVAGTWSSAGTMHSVMNGQEAVLLKSGQVLVVDGAIDGVVRRPERYDPGPFVAALSPSSATAGGPSFTLSVTGLLFSTSSVVRWNGSARATTFVSASTLTASIPASDIAAAGSAQVSVQDPAGLSNTASFTIGPPPAASTTTTVVSLTFDDSTSSHTVAQQVLDAHGVKGTFFVISGRVGAEGYLSLSQVRAIGADGHEIGGHTVNHYDLTTLVSSEVVHQVCDDKTQLERWGFKPYNFAYPFGAQNAGVAQTVKSCGYTSARTVGGSSCPDCPTAESIPPADAYKIATFESVKSTTTLAQLKSYVTNTEQAGGGWVVLVMHLISEDPNDTYSISSGTLSAFLDWLGPRRSSGTVVKTIGEVMGTPVLAPAPYLSSLSPEAAQTGASSFTLTAFGLGFSTSSVVRWNGAARPTTFLSSSTLTAAIPASDLAAPATAQITVAGPNGVSDAQPFMVIPPATYGSTTTLFSTLVATNAATASKPIEVGVKFRSDVAGSVVGVRFYKLSSANSGTHVGDLWSAAGTLLASAAFIDESPSGWQTVLFSTPVAILANTTYVASYHTTTQYSVTRNYFTNAGLDNAPLHALKTGVSGVNGVYAYGTGPTFPTNGVSDSNWWADVVFQPAQGPSAMSAMALSAATAVSTATAAAESFGFRDLYVFPNPSRRGRSMTIRLQAGVADTAELRIYDVSGRLIREAPFGAPKILDDGNGKGPQFTYDYQWDVGGVGSGVYIFKVNARKSGEPEIEKTGKGAIIK